VKISGEGTIYISSDVLNLKTYNDLYIEAKNSLLTKDSSGHALEARLLVSHAGNMTADGFIKNRLSAAPEAVAIKFFKLLKRRLDGEPLAYILGEWEFYGIPIQVSPHVLIPRIDTEKLVDTALDLIKNADTTDEIRVLDLCSGSGCIGIAILSNTIHTHVLFADNSPEALRVSRANCEGLGLENRAKFIEQDALEPPSAELGIFDLVVCNPPYIPSKEIGGLDISVKDFEPKPALDGGADGLEFYRAITQYWRPCIKKGGYLIFEAGINQADDIKSIMSQNGFSSISHVNDDLNIPRVIYGRC
jgi:release factor glutamine methyltransferase